MNAIYGYWQATESDLLESMAECLAHRGSHSSEVRINRFSRLGLRTSSSSSGEIFTYRGWICGYIGQTYGATPVEEFIKSLCDNGLEQVTSVNGNFIIVLMKDDELIIVRDPSGLKSIFFAIEDGAAYFASESKAIFRSKAFKKQLNPQGLVEYLSFSFTPSQSLVVNLKELKAGHYLRVQKGRWTEKPYVQNRICSEHESAGIDWVDRFKQDFNASIDDRLDSRQEAPAVFLSGGLDSSIVAGELARRYGSQLKTYTLFFGKKYANELDFAHLIVNKYKTDHQDIQISPKNFIPRLRKMIWHLDSPIGDPVTIGNFELARVASQSSDMVFNGEGGDPCFGGPKNLPMLLSHWYGGIDFGKGHRERAYLNSFNRCYGILGDLLTPEFNRSVQAQAGLEAVLEPYMRESQEPFLKKLLKANIELKGAHLILPKVERMLGAWGLSAESPLFDHRMVKLSLSMPEHLILDRGQEKMILKKAYLSDIPAQIIHRPKSGMRVPLFFWFQKEMKNYARFILNPKRIEADGIFRADTVKRILKYDIEEGAGRYGIRLWMLLTFEIWRRIYLEGEPV